MKVLGYHINLGATDGRVIAPNTRVQRTLARTVLTAGRDCGLLAFRAADTHLHILAACCRELAGRWLRSLSTKLRVRLKLPNGLSSAHFEPVADQRHLVNAFRYVLRQDERHGTQHDPLAEASNLPDLLGMRLIGGYTAGSVARLLPRIRAEELVARLDLTVGQLTAAAISEDAYEQLEDAAAATLGLPRLLGRSSEVVAARVAAVAVVGDALPTARLTRLLGSTARTIRRLKGREADPRLVEAVARQLRLRTVRTQARRDDALVLQP